MQKKKTKKVLKKKPIISKKFKKSPLKAKKNIKLLGVEDAEYWKKRPLDDKRRDWYEQGENWVEDYKLSVNHPHRLPILHALSKLEPFAGVLEVGCNAGPNLKMIQEKYPETQMAGIDVNEDAIKAAQQFVPKAILKVADVENLPFDDKSFDIVLADAVLIYISPEKIERVLSEINRVARKAVILCEWGDESLAGVVKDGHWARNYKALFEQLGFSVEVTKITEELWKNKSGNWARNGYVFVAVRA